MVIRLLKADAIEQSRKRIAARLERSEVEWLSQKIKRRNDKVIGPLLKAFLHTSKAKTSAIYYGEIIRS